MPTQTIVTVPSSTVIGVTARTTNRAEADPSTARIPALWRRFFEIEPAIPNRTDPNVVIAAYTAYESDHTGEYSLVVGAEVNSPAEVPEGLVRVILPSARYLVFTAEGAMPDALIRTWMDIWRYFSEAALHRRAYTTDFERYDKRQPARADVYVAID
ncbi:MAG: hypothetical protein V7647_3310 [Acidobacteriota bacterium]|jgi:predicted transcriptional regulator YdeE